MYRKQKITAIIAIAVAFAFVMPVAAVANFGTFGVTSDSENTSDIENIVEISTNSDTSDNIEIINDLNTEDTITEKTIDAIPSTGDIIYVDDDADPSWYDATHVKTIQEGVDNASAGWTVYVHNGFYYEHVLVNKQLDLVGQSKENVIVDGTGTSFVFHVKANYVSIDTFTITNGAYGIYLDWSSWHNVVNCDVYNNPKDGIYLFQSQRTNITNCNTYDNKDYGIHLVYSHRNNITNCNAYDNFKEGIYFRESSYNKLRGNAIYDNYCTFGITDRFNNDIDTSNTVNGKPMHYIVGQENLTFDETDNFGYLGLIECTNITVKNSDTYGILMVRTINSTISNVSVHGSRSGVFLDSCSGITVTKCNLYDNGNGIYLEESSDNSITDCDVYNNIKPAAGEASGVAGIYLKESSSNNNITNCNSYNNTGTGIYLYKASNKNNIINCDVYNNAAQGIQLYKSLDNNIIDCNVYNNSGFYGGIALWWSSNDNNIANCNAYDNKEYGIHLKQSSKNNNITSCSVYDNKKNGVYLDCAPDNTLRDIIIYDNVYNFGVTGGPITDFYQDIDASNTINGKPIFYLIEDSDKILDETHNFGYLALIECTNMTAKNSDTYGIVMMGTTDSTISNISVHGSTSGMLIHSCSICTVTECKIYDSADGIRIYDSSYCNITNCDIYDNMYGIYLDSSSDIKLRDNVIHDNVYNFGIEGGAIDDFVHNIDTTNTINGKPMHYLVGRENLTLDETDNFGYLGLVSCTNITAKNADVEGILLAGTTDSTISDVDVHDGGNNGICLYWSSDNDIIDCDIYDNNGMGIYIRESSNNNVTNCDIYNNGNGIYFYWMTSTNNNIINCDVHNNWNGIEIAVYPSGNNIINCGIYDNSYYGIYIWAMANYNTVINCDIYNNERGIWFYMYADNNLVHHNNFVNYDRNANDGGTGNTWDDGSEGNYWSDYTGVDEDGDGIGDTPYITGYYGVDNYPLMMIMDDTPPIITDVQATPEAQNTTEPLNITCAVTDNWDMLDTVKVFITDPYGFTLEATMNEGYWYEDTYATMGVYHYYIWANDAQRNVAVSDIYAFVITDLETPISAVDPLPTWNTAVPFTVTATAYDPTFSPGVENVTLWSRYSEDGAHWIDWTSYGIDEEKPWRWEFTGSEGYYEFYSIAIDDYGNVEEPPDVADATTGIDTIDPVTTHALSGTMGEDDWYVSDVVVTLSATDDTSGIASTWYQIDSGFPKLYTTSFTVSSNGEHTIQYYSFDDAGNREDTKSVDIKIDTIAPVTEHEFDGVIGEDGWFVGDVTVTLIAEDVTSGVNYTKYKLNDGDWITYTDPFVVTENGEYTLYYHSVDLAGNTETTNEVAFKIEKDLIPPVTTHDFDGIPGDNDWFTSNVAVTLIAVDDSAGVDYTMYKLDNGEWTEYEGTFSVTEDAEHLLSYYSVDKVVNVENVNVVELKIDQTVPTIELTSEKAGLKWLLIADVFDATSEVARVEFYVDGEFVGEVTEAPYEWTYSGKGKTAQAIVFDNAGNDAISEKVKVVSQSQSQSGSSTPVPLQILSWLFGLW